MVPLPVPLLLRSLDDGDRRNAEGGLYLRRFEFLKALEKSNSGIPALRFRNYAGYIQYKS